MTATIQQTSWNIFVCSLNFSTSIDLDTILHWNDRMYYCVWLFIYSVQWTILVSIMNGQYWLLCVTRKRLFWYCIVTYDKSNDIAECEFYVFFHKCRYYEVVCCIINWSITPNDFVIRNCSIDENKWSNEKHLIGRHMMNCLMIDIWKSINSRWITFLSSTK